jgi:hypothetical protein
MSRSTDLVGIARILFAAMLISIGGCVARSDGFDGGSTVQIVYVTSPDQCLSCDHAWQLFKCIRDHKEPPNVRLVVLLLCERSVDASAWRYSSLVDTVLVSTPNKPSPVYSMLSSVGDYQLFVLSGQKTLGYWKSTTLNAQTCDSVLNVIEHGAR